jgi:hypothetical protein
MVSVGKKGRNTCEIIKQISQGSKIIEIREKTTSVHDSCSFCSQREITSDLIYI